MLLERERPRRILVVEADALIGELISDVLEAAGFAVQTAPSATAALEVLGRESPHAALVDLARPGDEGWTFLARCRQQANCNQLPIAVMSATLAQTAAAAMARERGYGWLPKPFELDELLALMDDLTRATASRTVAEVSAGPGGLSVLLADVSTYVLPARSARSGRSVRA